MNGSRERETVRAGAGKRADRRVAIHLTLPTSLLDLLDSLTDNRTALIEEAIRKHPAVQEALAQLARQAEVE